MKIKLLMLLLFSSLISCDFICPPEDDNPENKTSDSTKVKEVQIKAN